MADPTSNPTAPSILVLGTGELGTSILHALTSHPHRPASTDIALLLRPSTLSTPDPTKRAELAALTARGIRLLPGDIAHDPEPRLAATFARFHTVIGASGMASPAGTQLRIARAVLAAGVKCYFPWQFGVDYDVIGTGSAQDLFSEQLAVRGLLRSQRGTRWVVVSTGVFMSFLFGPVFGVVEWDEEGKVSGVNALGSWETRVTATAVEDIGRVVAELVFVVTEERHKVVFVAGDTVSYGELADVLEAILGMKVVRREWNLEHLREDLNNSPEDGMKKYRVVFGEGVGVWWDRKDTFNMEKGLKTVGVREYAKKTFS